MMSALATTGTENMGHEWRTAAVQPSNGAVLSADGIHSRSDADVMASSASAPYCRPRAAELCLEHRHALMQRVALLSQLLRSCFGRNLYAGAAAQRKASDQ